MARVSRPIHEVLNAIYPADLHALSQSSVNTVLRPSNIHTTTLARRKFLAAIGVIHL